MLKVKTWRKTKRLKSGSFIGNEDWFRDKIGTALRCGNLVPIFHIRIVVQILTPVNQFAYLFVQIFILQIEVFLIELLDHFLFL